jgi:hypothetical protein
MLTRCPICESSDISPIFTDARVTKYGLQRHFTREPALQAEQGELAFHMCCQCTFVFNAAFNPATMDYMVDYESSRSHSQVFRDYMNGVAEEVKEVCDIEGKRVVEVGCGDGHFLTALRQKATFAGYGFDPSVLTDTLRTSFSDLRFVRGRYTSQSLPRPPDVLLLRHILEHQGRPHDFLESLWPDERSAEVGMKIYVEVPDWGWIVDHLQIQALSYDHCSYYSPSSMERLLNKYGVTADRVGCRFDNEYLAYFGSIRSGRPPQQVIGTDHLIDKTQAFGRVVKELIANMRDLIERYGADAVVWGAAGKGTLFLNLLNLDYNCLPYVVDSNPRRHKTYIPVTGQQVISPEDLRSLKPRCVLLTNRLYAHEIAGQLDALGVHSEMLAIDDLIRSEYEQLVGPSKATKSPAMVERAHGKNR